MSDEKPDVLEIFHPRFILEVHDVNGVNHVSEDRGNDEERPLKIPEGRALLRLKIDNKRPHPKGILINGLKSEGDCNGDLHTRIFDTKKRSPLELFISTPEPQRLLGVNMEAWSGEVYILHDQFSLQAGKCKLTVTGPINFKYMDKENNARGFEELNVTLSFWLEVEKPTDSNPTSSTANPGVPSTEANNTEKESKRTSS